MRQAIVIALVIAGAAGCATMRAAATRSTEEMLTIAGFHAEAADTPERLAHLTSLPPGRITRSTSQGQTLYVYPDPDVCRCLYEGTEAQYQEYQRLRDQRDIADERTLDTWSTWTPWPVWR
jgi:hypothetical protein